MLLGDIVNKKNGFTLVELLAVIAILTMIGLIAIPTVQSIILKSKEQTKVLQVKGIIKIAKAWASDNAKLLSKERVYYLPVRILLNEGYIQNEDIVDPTNTKNSLDQCVSIEYNSKYSNYDFKYVTCVGVTPGL